MSAGELDRRVTVRRRPPIEAEAGNDRGEFEPAFSVWAGYTPMSATRRAEYGYAEDVVSGWLKLRESRDVETLTIADRVGFNAEPDNDFAIDSVAVKDRSGYRLLRISRKM